MSTSLPTLRYVENGCSWVDEDQTTLVTVDGVLTNPPTWCTVVNCSEQYKDGNNCVWYDVVCAPNYDAPSPYNDGNYHTLNIKIECGDATGPIVCDCEDGQDGAPGPQGDCGEGFEHVGAWALSTAYETANSPTVCAYDVVVHNDVSYYCILDHTSAATSEPGVGATWQTYWAPLGGGGGTGNITWRGVWDGNSISYYEDDFVTHEGRSYMATTDHTSATDDPPDPEFDYEGGSNWILVSNSNGGTPEENSLWDNILDLGTGLFDWIQDIGNWGFGDWIKLLAGGAGLIWAGTQLVDMFDEDGEGDGEAGSQYTGDQTYTGTPADTTLPQVIEDLCEIAGITTYDTSAMPATAVNFTIGQITSARSVLQMLSQVYFFDMVDSGGILKFIPRDTVTSVKTLTVEEDLGWSQQGGGLSAPFVIKRLQGVDLPKSMSLTYFSEAAAHNEMVQTSAMQTYTEGQDTYLKVPVTLTEDEALEVAELTLINSHLEKTTYAFTTNWNHIDLEPGDVITVDQLGDLRILRIDEAQEVGLLNFVCVDAGYATQAYTPSGLPSQPPPTYTDAPSLVGYSAGLILEVPPLYAADAEDPHLTIAPHGYGLEGWPGAAIYVSDDNVNYSLVAQATEEATWGKVVSATPAPTGDYELWDDTTTIQVELKTGTLSSATELEVYNGTNWCVIGEEVIGFKTASLVSGTTYNISGLLRGRRGTEVKMGDHVANEGFILLDSSLVRYSYNIEDKEKTLYFKFVTAGSDLSKATAYTAQPNTVSIRPWQPHNLVSTAEGNDDRITWIGRNQFGGELVDSGPVLYPAHFGGFVIQAIDTPGGGETVLRTVVQQTPNWVYTEAMQTADGNAATHIRIAQIDLRSGPGYYDEVAL